MSPRVYLNLVPDMSVTADILPYLPVKNIVYPSKDNSVFPEGKTALPRERQLTRAMILPTHYLIFVMTSRYNLWRRMSVAS